MVVAIPRRSLDSLPNLSRLPRPQLLLPAPTSSLSLAEKPLDFPSSYSPYKSSKFRVPQVLHLPLLQKHRGCGVFFPFWDMPTRRRFDVQMFPIPLPFTFSRTLLQFFAHNRNATLSFSISSALCDKKREVELFFLHLCDPCVNSDSCFELSTVNFQPSLEPPPFASPCRSARIQVEML